MFWFFSNKKEVEKLKEDTKNSFDLVKKDVSSVSGWIKHLDSEKNLQKKEIEELKRELSSIKDEIEGIKNILSFMNNSQNKQVFKTPKQVLEKQTPVYAVQTGVQTGVQTPNLDNFSVMERAIIWILLNTDMKLGYEDIAAMTGKEKSTVRGQINAIKQKSEGLIKEEVEKNGKKRVYIPDEIKEIILKKSKVRIKLNKKEKKGEEN